MPLNTVVSAPVIPDPLGSDGNSSDSEEETNDTTQRFVVQSGCVHPSLDLGVPRVIMSQESIERKVKRYHHYIDLYQKKWLHIFV